jgi:hypothetical protein
MEMPQEAGANPFADPNTMAVYDQMRQTVSPKEFGDEMLAGAAQTAPEDVAAFKSALEQIKMPPEALDLLNNMVDEILANPDKYEEIRAKYSEMGAPDEILPEQFDPEFFAALNMAVDQMIAAPAGVQAFAQGGIAELKPIAKAIAGYGRNGDTMLAHITPAEARMLRRKGGSGTINPKTGLPEFFNLFKELKNGFKAVGKAVKSFAKSTVGKIVLPIALGFFIGPAAAGLLGVGATSVAGLAISGFVGSAGATLLAGGSLKDALKSGAVSGLTAGAVAGVGNLTGFSNIPLTGTPSTATFGQSISNQFDALKGMRPGAFTGLLGDNTAPVPTSGPAYDPTNMVAANPLDFGGGPVPGGKPNILAIEAAPAYNPTNMVAANPLDFGAPPAASTAPSSLYKPTTIGESFSKIGEGLGMGDKPASFETFKQGAGELFSPTGPSTEQINARAAELVKQSAAGGMPLPVTTAIKQATSELAPGILRTYAPAAVAGLGAMAAFGGFDTKPVEGGDITKSLMKPVTQRIAEAGTQRQMYMQGLPGVVYDEYGAPVYGQSRRLPTYDVPDYNSGGYGMSQGQGGVNMPSIYIPPPGTIGSRSVAQPYNNADMYSNLVPRGYAEGGTVTDLFRSVLRRDPSVAEIDSYKTQFGDSIDERERALFRETVGPELTAQRTSAAELATQQKAARDKVAQDKALRRSQGSGAMYANINAGLSALAPETNPMDTADTTFGSRNRQAQLANLQQTYAPMLQGQRNAMAQQSAALGQPARNLPSPLSAPTVMDRNSQLVQDQYARIGRTGFGGQTNQIDIPGFTGFVNQLQAGQMSPADLPGRFDTAVQDYMRANPNDRYTQYVQQYQRNQQPITTMPTTFMNMGGIAALGTGGYPRRTGQISGPGTEKSDSIPAMLSDGEFVMTAKAVRGAGKGNRRAGAKKMYALMNQLEKNAARG